MTNNKQFQYYIWASDPHGTGQPWINLIKQAQQKYPKSQIIFGGDYIDGNPNSLETVQFVYDQVKNYQAIALFGNHEQLMRDFVEKNDDLWFANGAKTTIKSFFGRGYSQNVARQKLKEDKYYQFLINLPHLLVRDHFIFVHAGVPCAEVKDGISQWNQRDVYDKYLPFLVFMDPVEYFQLWSRDEYIYRAHDDLEFLFAHNYTGKTIVTGHTPTSLIFGSYDDGHKGFDATYNWETGPDDDPLIDKRPCPVRKIQYPHESPRYLTDDGCHGCPSHHGNICVFNVQTGKLVEVFNDDPADEKVYADEKDD